MWRITFFILVLPFLANAQDETGQYIDKGLLRAQANLSMGVALKSFEKNAIFLTRSYITGNLEYYTSSQISIRGTSSFLLSGNIYGGLDKNYSILLGALYHFKTNNKLDPYWGIEPGVAITHLWNPLEAGVFVDMVWPYYDADYPTTINPIFTSSVGFNYYATKYFNLFANIQLVIGKHYSDIPAVSLNELKFSFGLGWHLWARKGYFKLDKPNGL